VILLNGEWTPGAPGETGGQGMDPGGEGAGNWQWLERVGNALVLNVF
jgi:hypothetical protein